MTGNIENIGFTIQNPDSFIGQINNISKNDRQGWVSKTPQNHIEIRLSLLEPAVIQKCYIKTLKTEDILLTGRDKSGDVLFVEEFHSDYQVRNNLLCKIQNSEVVTEIIVTLKAKDFRKQMGLNYLGFRGRILQKIVQSRSETIAPKALEEQVTIDMDLVQKINSDNASESISLEKVQKSMKNLSQDFICPINLELMIDPVVASDGHTYEKENIAKWLKKNRNSPMTGEKLKNKTLIPNLTIKKAIGSFKDNMRQLGITTFLEAQSKMIDEFQEIGDNRNSWELSGYLGN